MIPCSFHILNSAFEGLQFEGIEEEPHEPEVKVEDQVEREGKKSLSNLVHMIIFFKI